MANKRNGTLYVGVSSDLKCRVHNHKFGKIKCFSQRYECKKLVYYELTESMLSAISREKQLKAGSRKKKLMLIEKFNPEWKDLYETLF